MRAKPLLPLLLLLAGCADFTTQWTPGEAPKQIRVDVSRRTYEVHFARGGTSLGTAEATRLARFVAEGGILSNDRVAFEQADSSGKLAARRRDAVLKALRTDGVGASVSVAPAATAGRDRVVLLIERGVATPPPCPDWSKPPIDYSGQVSSDFGCATATNLANMVADPADLLRGNRTAPASGTIAAGAVQAYQDHQAWGPPLGQTPFTTDFYGTDTASSSNGQ